MKVGIAGTGKIVREFLNMQKTQERIEVTALVCRPQSEKTGRELAGNLSDSGSLYGL